LKTDKTRYLKLYEKFKISSIEPKPPEDLPRPVILRILEQMPLKWKAFYSLMYETGYRVSEARALKIKNLELLPDGSWEVFFPESKWQSRLDRIAIRGESSGFMVTEIGKHRC